MKRKGLLTLAGSAVGVGAGLVAQHALVQRRRRDDPEAAERFGERRGSRCRVLDLPDGARLFIEETGPASASAAVFIHGSCLRTDLWHYQMKAFPRRRCIFYDLRGHGLSQPKGDSDYSIKTHAADLEAVIGSSNLEEVVLVGHSVGGMIALELCSARPELLRTSATSKSARAKRPHPQVAGVVLLNTTYRPAAETFLGGALAKVERVTRRPLDYVGSRADYVQRLRKLIRPSDALFMAVSLSGFGPSASARQVDFTYDMLADTPADVIFDLIKSYRDFDVTDALGRIDVPALVVGGTHDRLTAADASTYMAEHLPRAELKLLQGCGHMSMLERHRQVNSLLRGFLDKVLAAAAPEEAGA